MPVMIFTMLVVLVLAAAIITVVVMGMEGTGRKQHPEIAEAMARTARHLNGEAEPPRALVQLFDEIDEVGDINVRELPDRLRASARSAWSARSAASANQPEPSGDAEVATPTDLGSVDVGEPVEKVESVHADEAVEVGTSDDVDASDELVPRDEDWAPRVDQDVPEESGVDEETAQELREALAAPIGDLAEDDPYGVVTVHLAEGEARA